MPPEAMTADTASTAAPYADTLSTAGRPSLSATSDMPVIDLGKPAQAEALDSAPKPDQDDGTSGDTPAPDAEARPEGEADAQPKEAGGEEKDKTSPQARAAFARERNRRQAAEQRATALETQVAQLAQAVAKLAGEDKKEDPRPSRETFDSPDAYDAALEGWASRRATDVAKAEAKAEQQTQLQEAQNKALRDAFTARREAFEKDHPDFEDVAFATDVPISLPMSQAILEAEDGPAIAYHLGENPDLAERISKLSQAQAIYEIGRISSKLAAPPPKPKPAPIVPLATRNSAGEKSPDEMSMEEYARISPNRRQAN